MKSRVAGRSRDRRRRWSVALAYAVLLASCDSPFAPERQDVERLDVNPAVLTLVVGGNFTLTAKVYGPNDLLLPAAKVFWSTQDPTVVTVSQDGLVNAVAAGTAQIAASSGGQSRTIAVTVAQKPIALVRIAPPAASVITGQTFQLHGEALDGDGNVLPNRPLEWSSTQPTIATVNGAGLVTGVAVGQTTISAIGEGRVGTSLITVTPAPVASITIQPNGGSVPAGGTLTFTATARDAGGQVLPGRPITWRSSNDAVATVSAAGLMSAISPGVATITASAPNAGPNGTTPTASVNVTVLIEPVASAVIVPSPAGVQVGQVLNLTVNLFDSGGKPLSAAGRTIAWSSSNTVVATVNSSGAATGVAVGNATITATITTPGQAGSVQGSVQLTVSNQPVASVQITPNTGFVHAGYSRQFTAVALDAQGQPLPGRQIIWTSSNQGVATVDAQTGTVAGINPGSVQIRATAEGVQGVANITVDLVRVSNVAVNPPAPTLMPGQTVQLTAVARDSAFNSITGNALGGRTTTWNSATPAAATVTVNGLVTAVAQGSSTVTATIGGTSGQSQVTVSPLPTASQLAITTQPSASVPNDAPFAAQPVVQLKDINGNNVATAGVVITAAITAPGTGTLGGTTTAITNAGGAATFTDLKITGTIGARTLTFTSGALPAVTSSGINVTAGAATQLILVTPPPSTANSGQAFASASIVQLKDISGNNATQIGVPVTAAVSPNAGVSLTGSSATTDGSGAATFGALTLTGAAGGYTLTFSSGSLTPVTSGTVTLSAGSASTLAVIQQPGGTAQNGAAFSPQPQVQLQDGSGNPVALAGVQVTANIFSGGGTLFGTNQVITNSSGIATFTNLSITGTVGPRSLLFAAIGYSSVASGTINITAGPPAALVMVAQPPSTVQNGVAFSTSVKVADASGNGVPSASVSVSLNGAGASPGGNAPVTADAAGIATFSGLTITGLVGTYSLNFTSGALPPIQSSSIALTPGAAFKLSIATPPGGAVSGAAFTSQPAIQVQDASNNATSVGGPFTVTAGIASGTGNLVGGTTANTNGSGLATFSGLGIAGTVGPFTLAFTSAPLAGVPSGTFALAPGAPAQVTIQTQPAGASSGAAFTTQPVVLVSDAQGNAVGAGITVTASPNGGASLVGSGSASTNASGVATFSGLGLSGLVSGTYSITFTSGTGNATSGSIPLAPGAPAQLVMSSQPPASVAHGTAFSAAVQIQDAAGNPVPVNGAPVSIALNGAGATLSPLTPMNTVSGVATFSGLTITGSVGTYSLNFTSGALPPVQSSSIALTPGAAFKLAITTPPGGAVSGAAFTSQPAIQVQDASNNATGVGGPFTITAAITSGTGSLFSATATTNGSGSAVFSGLGITGTAGPFTLSFTSGLLSPVNSGVTLGPGAPANVSIQTQPGGAVSGVAFTTQPVVLVTDAQSNPVGAGITVTATPNGGGSLFGGSASTNASGVATFSGLGLSGLVTGTHSVTFSSGTGNATSGTIPLAPGAPAQVTIQTQPAGASSGAAFGTQPVVLVSDAQGNPVGAGIAVTAAPNGGASLVGTATALTDASGVASFSNLGLSGLVSGTYSVTFSGGTGNATSGTIPLTHGAAAQIVITQQPPATAAIGASFAAAVQIRDAQGNPVLVAGTPVSATSSPTGVAGGLASTDPSGTATFSLSFIVPGSYTITFSNGSISSAPSTTVGISFFDIEASAPDVTEVTIANPDYRGADLPRVSILPDEWALADVGNLNGTPTSPAPTQEVASLKSLTIASANRDQLRFGATRRGTIVSNPFVVNP